MWNNSVEAEKLGIFIAYQGPLVPLLTVPRDGPRDDTRYFTSHLVSEEHPMLQEDHGQAD